MPRYREVPVANTGTSTRMQTLPVKPITSLENHRETVALPFSPYDKRNVNPVDNSLQNRKCVYHYEDKYTFARILHSDCLVFDSHFESGNLLSAYRVTNPSEPDKRKVQYDLYMHNDVHTKGNTQWFYFSVGNVKAGQEVNFVIRNFGKSDSLYNQGLRPLMYSTTSKVHATGWTRVGTNIMYFECPPNLAYEQSNINYSNLTSGNSDTNPTTGSSAQSQGAQGDSNTGTSGGVSSGSVKGKKKKKGSGTSGPPMYSVSFTHVFDKTGDVCYFAFCHPYTYTDLQNYLMNINTTVKSNVICRRSVLCRTIAGNPCDLLTITAPCSDNDVLQSRVGIVITARVHPGETVASWIMQVCIRTIS